MKPNSKFRLSAIALAVSAATIQLSYAQTVEVNPAGAIPAAFSLVPSGTWNWNTNANLEGWTAGANNAFVLDPGTPVGGFVKGTSAAGAGNNGDASFTSPITTIATPYRVIVEFRIKKEATDTSRIDLFWDDAVGGFGGPRLLAIPPASISADGTYKTIRVTFPYGKIATQLDRLRIDPIAELANVGKTAEIDYVHVYTENPTSLSWDVGPAAGAQGGSGTWDELITANWWTGAANTTWPASGARASFGSPAGTVTVAGGGVNATIADFQTTGYTFDGGPIKIGSDSASFTTAASAITRFNSQLQGSAPLTLSPGSGGGFVLGGNNPSLTGGITLANRSIGIVTDGALGSGTLTLGAGANTFISALNGGRTIANNVIFAGNRTVIQNDAGVGASGDLGTGLPVGNLTINGTLALNMVSPGDIFLPKTLTVNGVVSGSNNGIGLYFAGTAGTMVLTNSNTFTGGIKWDTSTVLLVNSDAALGDLSNNLTFASGSSGLLKTSAGITSARGILISGAGSVARIDTNGFDSTLSGAITNSGAATGAHLTKLGAGQLTLTTATSTLGAAGIWVQGGSLKVGTGATITSGSNTNNGVYAGATLEIDGGSLQTGLFSVGKNAGTSTFTLTSGTYTNGAELIVGFDGDGVFNLNGGLADLTQLSLTDAAPFTSTINLNGGTVSLQFFNARANAVTPATATINFNGSVITSEVDNTDFIQTDSTTDITANVGAGGAKFNTAGFNITINEPLLHDAALGLTPDGGLTKLSAGTLTLTGANTYTGDTVVSGGILAVSGNSIADTGKLVINGAKVQTTGTEVVSTLFFGATQQAAGTWGATGSGAINIDDTKFAGIAGVVDVQNGLPAGNTFAAWLAANPPATGFTTDSDNDGVPNGVENVLGTDPNTSSAGLTQVSATASSVTFQHTLNPTIASDVSYSYEWSTDLVEWKASGVPNSAGTIGTIVASAPVAGVVTVTTTRSGTASGKMFTRIKVGNP